MSNPEADHFLDWLVRSTGHTISQVIRDAIIEVANQRLIPSQIESDALPYFVLRWPTAVPRMSHEEIAALPRKQQQLIAQRFTHNIDRPANLCRCAICKRKSCSYRHEIHLHHDDYSFPERVTPLCMNHHFQRHSILTRRFPDKWPRKPKRGKPKQTNQPKETE